ncbi:hypothetical protein D3C87_234030 [compost metagenome]
MKRIILSINILFLCFSLNAQRSLDLELEMTSPANGTTFESMELFNLLITIKNVDASTSFQASDSLYYYMLIFGDTVPFGMSGNYLGFTGNAADPAESFTISRMMTFTENYEGVDVELCIFAKPMNAANAVFDPDLSNNMDCAILTIVPPDNLSADEYSQNAFRIHPNPSNERFSISNPEDFSRLMIYDLNGNSIRFHQNPDGSIDCSAWENGIYFIHGSNSAGNFVKRMIVSH